MRRSSSKPAVSESNNGSKERIEWELRPGGMLVQKREDEVGAAGPTIKIKVSHGSYQHEITVPAQSTFGDPFSSHCFPPIFAGFCVYS